MLRILSRLIIAASLILAATTAARADPVSILILGFLGINATALAVAITTFALSTIASIGLSYLARALAPKPSLPDISSLPGGTTGKLQTGGIVPRSIGVGRFMTAGSLAYANTYSPSAATAAAASLSLTTAAAGNTPNAYLVQVIAVSDIPISALVSLFVGSLAATYNSGATPSFEGRAVPEFTVAGKEHLWIRFYDGTQVAADPQLVALFGTDPDRPYTSARIGTGIAYVVVTSLVNQDKFPNFPQCKFVLDGIKLYDRRYDTSVGGSGSQRWATPSTWALTKNPIVISENILRGISYGGTWLYGAQTVTETQVPFASWTAAASECDTAINLAAGGTEAQFAVGGEIRLDIEPANTLEELLKACNGRMAEIGGSYKVRSGAAGAAVFSFTDGDILSTEQQTFEPFPSLGQTINAVKAKYISPAEGWVAKDAPPLYDTTLETADGGRRLPVDINYSFVTSGTQVQRLMKAARDTHRAMRTHALPMPPDAFVLEPLDVVSWTSTRNGYSSKLFDIETAEDLPNLNMGLAIREIDPNAYDWTPGTDERPIVDGTIVLLRPPAQPMAGWNAVPWTILSDDNRQQPGIKLSWTSSTDDIDGVRFEIRIKDTAEVIHRGETDAYADGSIIISQNLIANTVYQARGQYRPASVRDVAWSSWLDVTTPNILITVDYVDELINSRIDAALEAVRALNFDVNAGLTGVVGRTVNERLNELSEAAVANILRTAQIENTLRGAGIDIDPDRGTVKLWAFDRFQDDYAIASASLSASISAEGVARAAADLVLQANIDGANASIVSEQSVRASADSALTASINTLTATVNGVSATVTITIASPGVVTWTAHGFGAGRRVKFTTTDTLPTGITPNTYYYVLSAGLAADTFRISATPEGTAINTSGSQSGTHTGTAASTNASVETEAVARVTSDNSLSASISTLTAQYNDVSAGATFRTVAGAGSSGATAVVDMQVSASVGGTFAAAGIQIAAFAGATPYSHLRLYADKIYIGIPGVTGGDYFAPFGVEYVNGAQQMALRSEAIPDGAVKIRTLETGALGSYYVASGSDVTKTENQWNNSGAGDIVLSATVNVAVGSALHINFSMMVTYTTGGNATSGWVKLKVAGTQIKIWNKIASIYGSPYGEPYVIDELVNNLAGGSTAVEVSMYMAGTTGYDRVAVAPKFILQEIPKPNVVDVSTTVTPSVSYRTSLVGGSDGTSGSFSAVDIGTADSYRVVVIAVGWHNTTVSPAVTVGGVNAPRITSVADWFGQGTCMGLYAVRYQTGTTADIVASFPSGSPKDINIHVWKVVAASVAPSRACNNYTTDANTTGISQGDIQNAVAGEVFLYAVYGGRNDATLSGSWSGSDTVTERADAATGTTQNRRYGAYDLTRTQSGDKTLTITQSNAALPMVGVGGRWK